MMFHDMNVKYTVNVSVSVSQQLRLEAEFRS